MSKIKIYTKSILIPVIVGGIVSLLISQSIDYNELVKPVLAPPSTVFPIVWTLLYILMGVSYGILQSKDLVDSKINTIYYLQLAINSIWPILFFLLKWRLFAFIWIVILAIAVLVMVIQFYKKDKLAGLLQIPYLLWTLFASYLNLGVYILNRIRKSFEGVLSFIKHSFELIKTDFADII